MDTGIDFIQPEFLNILFFQQKNLILFPYIDLKHLHSLEIFTAGYNVVDLESTALHNIKEIIEFEANNSYSQNPSFYFIINITKDKIKEILEIENIRCILNTNERVEDLTNNESFVLYNKKNKKFINYNKDTYDLEFEKLLISSSENLPILQDKIQEIKAVSTRIFTEINQDGNVGKVQEILSIYAEKFWSKLLDFTKLYYQIEIPNELLTGIFSQKVKKTRNPKKISKDVDFSNEYDLIVTLNKNIAKEFIQLLHEYRSNKVNPSNLDLEQLYNPEKLYNYLRNHHWKSRISDDFLLKWIGMEISRYSLTSEDYNDFDELFKVLKIPDEIITKTPDVTLIQDDIEISQNITEPPSEKIDVIEENIPSVREFSKFKMWLLEKIDEIEKIIG